jgi:Myb-like DNA-binding domain
MGIFARETEPHQASCEIFDDYEPSVPNSVHCLMSMDTNIKDTYNSDAMMKTLIATDAEIQVSNQYDSAATYNETGYASQQTENIVTAAGLNYATQQSNNIYARTTKHSSAEIVGNNVDISKSKRNRIGRWTLDEKLLFLFGLQKFGKGRWKKISLYLPHRQVTKNLNHYQRGEILVRHASHHLLIYIFRSLVQIKSHAQKVLKRIEMGENVFRRLEENCTRLNVLVSEIHQAFGLDQVPIVFRNAVNSSSDKTINCKLNVQNQVSQSPTIRNQNPMINISTSSDRLENVSSEGSEHNLAASALCQLASPDESMDQIRSRMGWQA